LVNLSLKITLGSSVSRRVEHKICAYCMCEDEVVSGCRVWFGTLFFTLCPPIRGNYWLLLLANRLTTSSPYWSAPWDVTKTSSFSIAQNLYFRQRFFLILLQLLGITTGGLLFLGEVLWLGSVLLHVFPPRVPKQLCRHRRRLYVSKTQMQKLDIFSPPTGRNSPDPNPVHVLCACVRYVYTCLRAIMVSTWGWMGLALSVKTELRLPFCIFSKPRARAQRVTPPHQH
jgi:hypothetical protein